MQRLNLPWLCPPPANFRQKLKAIRGTQKEVNAQMRLLLSCALDNNQLYLVAKYLDKFSVQDEQPSIKFSVLSNSNSTFLMPAICATALRYGLRIHPVPCEYDQVMQQALNPGSPVHNADMLLVALDQRGIAALTSEWCEDEDQAVGEAIGYIQTLYASLGSATLILQTVPQLASCYFGNSDAAIRGSQMRRINRFNEQLSSFSQNNACLLFDVASLANLVGLDTWHDEGNHYLSKIPFAQVCVPLYSDYLLRLMAAAKGKLKKCLVLDLDNTIWGGIVGDDGVDGIKLGQGSVEGEAFLAIQRMALALRARGIILAVCSKNNEEVARSVFKSHPDMLLREEHIAVFMANWRDKASNIESIAKILNIGIDSLVFLDDNPVERQQVREEHSCVAVPELPEDATLYPRYLAAAGYFETLSFSDEDKTRAHLYQNNEARVAEASNYRNIDEFLASLKMEIQFAPFDAVGRTRIAQLILRSNQFNLTTKRYTEAEIEAFERDRATHTFQIRLNDKFGDNGMVSVVIAFQQGTSLLIDTWLMSCRVLNRRVEECVLEALVKTAQSNGCSRIVGRYMATEKNDLVREHYQRLGFSKSALTDNENEWVLELANYVQVSLPFTIMA